MQHVHWEDPVKIAFMRGVVRKIDGPSEALRCLADLWPDQRGPNYVSARMLCRAALAGRRSAEEARMAFMTATREAHLNVN
ncbi:DUF982 domain-containing protein [Rhizobium sp. RAF56]|uniref:DUF982 domain-containing protein n=1 Tax=Rhizobium sp. RAF56 TaxID=3233062 RepID=UPI003F94A8A2